MLPEERFAKVLDDALARSRVGGERSIGIARFVLAALVLLRMLIVGPPLRAGAIRDWVLVGVLGLAFAASLLIDRQVRSMKHGRHSTIIGISVVCDTALVMAALSALSLWPYPGYEGLIRSPFFAYVICALLGSALRFSLPLVITSLLANGLGLGLLILYEIVGPRHQRFELEELLTVIILFASSGTLALSLVLRGRKLIYQGAKAVLHAERAANRLGTYVSSEVAERAMANAELVLGGARQPVVCLFSDLRGFTSYAESLPPEQLVAEINAYLEAMVAAVATEGGVIDKFIGDAIMVVFGVPAARPDDAARAIRTARAMQRALAKHNVARRARGLPLLVQGIGVHGGPAIVGNIGTAARMQHTVMGSVVNVASRLEAATKEVGVAVLISAATVDAAKASGAALPELRPLPAVSVRGVRDPLAVYCFPDDGFSAQSRLPESSSGSAP